MNFCTGDRRPQGRTHNLHIWLYVLLCLLSQFLCPWILTAASVIANPTSFGQVLFPCHTKPLKSFITNIVQLHWSMVSKTFLNTCSFCFLAAVLISCLTSFFYYEIWRCLQCCLALGMQYTAEIFYRRCMVPGFWVCNKALHRALTFTATDSEENYFLFIFIYNLICEKIVAQPF